MKRMMCILLAVLMIFSLSACGSENAANDDAALSTTQNQTVITDTSATEPETEVSISTTGNTVDSDGTDIPSSTTTATPETTESTTTTTKATTTTTKATTTTTKATTTTTKAETTNSTTTTTHTHKYSDATCSEPAKCSCGETKGSALGHDYGKATCTEAKKCSRCGKTSGSALGHNWKEASCTAPKTCARCNKTEGKSLPHSYQDGKCKTCERRQLGVGCWTAFILEKNEFIGTDLTVISIYDDKSITCLSYMDMETMDSELLKELQQENCTIITYQGKQYIEYAGMGGPLQSENVSEDSITLCSGGGSKIPLKRISDTQAECIIDVVDWSSIKQGTIFTYQD